MKSILNNLTSNDLDKISKKDLENAFANLNSNKNDIKKLSNNVRKIILWIIEITKSENLDISSPNLSEELLTCLKESNDISKVWIWTILWEKIWNKVDYEKLAYYDEDTWLPNNLKLKFDIEKIKWNKIIILVKILWLDNLNRAYWYEWWNKILKEAINWLKSFENAWFKLYRWSWITFWLLRENPEKYINENDIEHLVKRFITNFHIEIPELWKISIKTKVWIAMNENASFKNTIMALSKSEKIRDITVYNDSIERELKEKAIEKELWKNSVKEALRTWDIIPFFQWIRDNNTWKIKKYESLVRMRKWDIIIWPWSFLNHIQWTRLMKELTKAMIIATIKEMTKNNLSFSVNLTESDLLNDEIINLIETILNENNINPSRLTIEVLEEVWINNDLFIKSIKRLKNLWLKIAIDDFWSWFSWFDRVYKAEPDYLKIDWSLIEWISNDSKKLKMLKSIVSFAHSMWAKVIAERIEDKETQKILEKINVDFSQWYLFSKPKEKIEIEIEI